MDDHTDVFMLKKQYLNLLDRDVFTIIVKNKKYNCNIFGVQSSEVIRELLEKNPNLRQYVYSFDDQTDDFQLICNFFNFEKIHITTKNMISLRSIAENLKIDAVLTDINNYIDSYEDIVQKTNPIEELFGWLYHIKEITVKTVKESILESPWVHSESNIKEFVAFILQVVRSGYLLQPYLIELIISLDESKDETNDLHLLNPFIVKQLLLCFYKSQFYCSFVYKLSKSGIISIDQIISQIYSVDTFLFRGKEKKIKQTINNSNQISYEKFDASHHKNVVTWFLPELIESKKNQQKELFNSIDKKTSSFLQFFLPKKLDLYKNLRDTCEPNNDMIKSIIIDDVDTLQTIITKGNVKINSGKPSFNSFEIFNDCKSKSLLDYSAEYGALKCFKYLLLNHAKTDESTLGYAIYGGNTEIIRTVDQIRKNSNYYNSNNQNQIKNNQRNNYWQPQQFQQQQQTTSTSTSTTSILTSKYFSFDDNNLLCPVNLSIMMHQYNLFDWIIDEKIKSNSLTNQCLIDLAKMSIISGNVHSFIQCVDKGLVLKNDKTILIEFIKIAAEFGFYRLAEFILCLYNDDISKVDIGDSSIIFGNLSISKLFFSMTEFEFNYERLLLISLQRENYDISQYIIDYFYQPKNSKNIVSVYMNSINEHSNIFNYIENKYRLDEMQTLFNISSSDFLKMLNICCVKKNYEIFCKLFEFVNKTFSIVDFTEQFLEACYAGSEEIYQYLVDKKIFINFSEVLNKNKNIFHGNWKIALKMLDIINSEMKPTLSRLFFNEAVNNKNKEAFKALMSENLNDSQLLLKAAKFHDIELVNNVLQHNSKPEFVNQIFKEGTVIKMSVKNNDLDILKRLLSIPGIDLNIRTTQGFTPLICSINELNIEAMNMILDFYGDDIQSQLWQFEIAIRVILKYVQLKENVSIENFEEKMVIILNRILKVNKNLSTRYHDFISDACQNNLCKLVQMLLKVEEINVNFHNTKNGDTPLITAIKNKNSEIINSLIYFPETDINLSNFNNQTPLIIAVEYGMEVVVSALINHPKFDPVLSNIKYAFFISSDNKNLLNLLYSVKDLDVNYQYDQFVINDPKVHFMLMETTLTNAVKQKQNNKINLIISHPQFDPIKSNIKSALFNSIYKSDSAVFKLLYKFVNDANTVSYNGKSLIQALLEQDKYNLLQEMLNDCNINIDDDSLLNYFIFALSNDNKSVKMLDCLLDYDKKHNNCINFNQLLKNGYSFFTTINPNLVKVDEFVKFLLDHDADPNMPDKFGIYPLQYAIDSESYQFVKALVNSKKIDFSIRLNRETGVVLQNETYLHLAARCCETQILLLLLKSDVIDINSTDDLNETPFIKAQKTNNVRNAAMIKKYMKSKSPKKAKKPKKKHSFSAFINNNNNNNENENEEDENDDDDEEIIFDNNETPLATFHHIHILFKKLESFIKISGNTYEDMRQVTDHDAISLRQSLLNNISKLFNKLSIFDTYFVDEEENLDDDDDEYDVSGFLDFDLDVNIYGFDDDPLQNIKKMFIEIKKINRAILSSELDLDEKMRYLFAFNQRVLLINRLIYRFINENDEAFSNY